MAPLPAARGGCSLLVTVSAVLLLLTSGDGDVVSSMLMMRVLPAAEAAAMPVPEGCSTDWIRCAEAANAASDGSLSADFTELSLALHGPDGFMAPATRFAVLRKFKDSGRVVGQHSQARAAAGAADETAPGVMDMYSARGAAARAGFVRAQMGSCAAAAEHFDAVAASVVVPDASDRGVAAGAAALTQRRLDVFEGFAQRQVGTCLLAAASGAGRHAQDAVDALSAAVAAFDRAARVPMARFTLFDHEDAARIPEPSDGPEPQQLFDSLSSLATAALQAKNYSVAAAAVQRASALDPQSASLHVLACKILDALGQPHLAVPHAQFLVHSKPYRQSLSTLGRAESLARLGSLLLRTREPLRAGQTLAMAMRELGGVTRGSVDAQAAMALAPAITVERAYAAIAVGDMSAAVLLAQLAVRLTTPGALAGLGATLQNPRKGAPASGIGAAVQVEPDGSRGAALMSQGLSAELLGSPTDLPTGQWDNGVVSPMVDPATRKHALTALSLALLLRGNGDDGDATLVAEAVAAAANIDPSAGAGLAGGGKGGAGGRGGRDSRRRPLSDEAAAAAAAKRAASQTNKYESILVPSLAAVRDQYYPAVRPTTPDAAPPAKRQLSSVAAASSALAQRATVAVPRREDMFQLHFILGEELDSVGAVVAARRHWDLAAAHATQPHVIAPLALKSKLYVPLVYDSEQQLRDTRVGIVKVLERMCSRAPGAIELLDYESDGHLRLDDQRWAVRAQFMGIPTAYDRHGRISDIRSLVDRGSRGGETVIDYVGDSDGGDGGRAGGADGGDDDVWDRDEYLRDESFEDPLTAVHTAVSLFGTDRDLDSPRFGDRRVAQLRSLLYSRLRPSLGVVAEQEGVVPAAEAAEVGGGQARAGRRRSLVRVGFVGRKFGEGTSGGALLSVAEGLDREFFRVSLFVVPDDDVLGDGVAGRQSTAGDDAGGGARVTSAADYDVERAFYEVADVVVHLRPGGDDDDDDDDDAGAEAEASADAEEDDVRDAGGVSWHRKVVRILAAKETAVDVLVFADVGKDSWTYLLAHERLAPVQVAFWGALAPAALPAIDYWVTSPLFSPQPEAADGYDAQLVQLDGVLTAMEPPRRPNPVASLPQLGISLPWSPNAPVGADVLGGATGDGRPTECADDDYFCHRGENVDDTPRYGAALAKAAAEASTALQEELDGIAHLFVVPGGIARLHPAFDSVLVGLLESDKLAHVVVPYDPGVLAWKEVIVRRLTRKLSKSAGRRLLFATPKTQRELHSLLARATAVLDTFPVGGAMTCWEALAMDAPVVTAPALQPAQQFAAGLARRMNVTSLVAADADEYVALAVRVATDARFRHKVVADAAANKGRVFGDAGSVRAWEQFLYRIV